MTGTLTRDGVTRNAQLILATDRPTGTSRLEHGVRADERLFGEYVQPTFSILERIHLDYLQILKVLRSNLFDMLTTETPTLVVDEPALASAIVPGLLIPDSYNSYYASAEYRNTVEAAPHRDSSRFSAFALGAS